jgi:hypothetical protein
VRAELEGEGQIADMPLKRLEETVVLATETYASARAGVDTLLVVEVDLNVRLGASKCAFSEMSYIGSSALSRCSS